MRHMLQAVRRGVRIGIEGKVLTRQIGGIGRCAINLLESMLAVASTEYPDLEFVIFSAPQTDVKILGRLTATVCARFRRVKSSLLRSSFLLPVGIALEGIDLFHGLDQSGIPWFFKHGKCVVTIHDVLPLVLPAAFPLRHRLVSRYAMTRVCRQADMVLVPSIAVQEDVGRYLHIDESRVIVIPWGCEERFQPTGDPARYAVVQRRYRLPERYALFLGTLEPRKDIVTLLHAFSILQAEQCAADVKLVIAGGHGWGYDEVLTTCTSLGLHDEVQFTGFVKEEDLPEVYRGAQLFVYPSLCEGFGLPILEAMASGVPVITSNASAMPEVAGQAAILVEPKHPEALASAMAEVLSDEQLAHHLRCKGLQRAGQFSWEAVARQTLGVYAALL
jgi:glycosyltransferase involved in cell wall biosynthesis